MHMLPLAFGLYTKFGRQLHQLAGEEQSPVESQVGQHTAVSDRVLTLACRLSCPRAGILECYGNLKPGNKWFLRCLLHGKRVGVCASSRNNVVAFQVRKHASAEAGHSYFYMMDISWEVTRDWLFWLDGWFAVGSREGETLED